MRRFRQIEIVGDGQRRHMARVWDAASGEVLAKPEGGSGPVFAAAFSPDGQRVVTAS